jgi:hypothetical protein
VIYMQKECPACNDFVMCQDCRAQMHETELKEFGMKRKINIGSGEDVPLSENLFTYHPSKESSNEECLSLNEDGGYCYKGQQSVNESSHSVSGERESSVSALTRIRRLTLPKGAVQDE